MGSLVSFLLSRLTHVWLPVLFGDRERVNREQERLADQKNYPDTREW